MARDGSGNYTHPTGTAAVTGTPIDSTKYNNMLNEVAAALNEVWKANIRAADLTGLDAKLVTGTSGTDGNLASWNADGDLVDGGISATGLATETYVDNAVANLYGPDDASAGLIYTSGMNDTLALRSSAGHMGANNIYATYFFLNHGSADRNTDTYFLSSSSAPGWPYWNTKTGMQKSLDLEPGVDIQAYSANLASLSGVTLQEGDILYATGADTLARLAKGTADQVLTMNAGATAPEWATPAEGGGADWTYGTTAITSTGVTISGIPAGVQEIELFLDTVSNTGDGNMMVRIGDSGGIEASGYLSYGGVGPATGTTYFHTGSPPGIRHGVIRLNRCSATGNEWSFSSVIGSSTTAVGSVVAGGTKTLSGELTQILFGGTDTIIYSGNIHYRYR